MPDSKDQSQCQGSREVGKSVYVQESKVEKETAAKSNFDAKLTEALDKVED